MGLLALAALLLGACCICVFHHPGLLATVAGWLGFVLFGLASVKLVVDMLRAGTRVTISVEGIEDRRLKIGIVPWE